MLSVKQKQTIKTPLLKHLHVFFAAHYSLQPPLHLFEAIMVHSSLWKDSHPGWLLAWSVLLLPNDGKWSSTSILLLLLLLSLMSSVEKGGDWIAGMRLRLFKTSMGNALGVKAICSLQMFCVHLTSHGNGVTQISTLKFSSSILPTSDRLH